MSEPYTPTKAQIEDAYVQVHGSFAPGEHEKSLSEFDRWLNRVRAEALREASWKYILECRTPADVRDMIRAEAARIEQNSEGN